MMNFWMVVAYEMLSKADEYWFGFILRHQVYLVKDIPFEKLATMFRKDRTSSRKGGKVSVRIRATVNELEALLPEAVLLGDESVLKQANKGDALEQYISEEILHEPWVKNSVPFWVAGDLVVDGKQVQVKFNQAQLVNEMVFENNFPELVP